jgi:hypothetical protein
MLNELVVAVAPLASVTVAVTAKVPAVVGVPEITPELRVSPAGKVLVVNVLPSKPPEAESVSEKDEFTVADWLDGVVMLRAEAIVSVAAEEVVVAVVPFRLFVTTTEYSPASVDAVVPIV